MALADFYGVDLRALLDGEDRPARPDPALDETVQRVADYTGQEKQALTRRMHGMFLAGLGAALLFTALYFIGREDNFLGGLCLGVTVGMMLVGVLLTSRHAARLRAAKRRLLGLDAPRGQ